jgi:hypothetical protein
LVSAVDVSSAPYEGVEVVRAELTVAAGQPPGFLFGAVSRGSLVELINGSGEPRSRLPGLFGYSGPVPRSP